MQARRSLMPRQSSLSAGELVTTWSAVRMRYAALPFPRSNRASQFGLSLLAMCWPTSKFQGHGMLWHTLAGVMATLLFFYWRREQNSGASVASSGDGEVWT